MCILVTNALTKLPYHTSLDCTHKQLKWSITLHTGECSGVLHEAGLHTQANEVGYCISLVNNTAIGAEGDKVRLSSGSGDRDRGDYDTD